MVYKIQGGILYREKLGFWGNVIWVEEDQMFNLFYNIQEGEQCRVSFTDYGNIGSKCMYFFNRLDKGCIYSCESILVELDNDYIKLLGYFPKKMFYTKIYE